MKKSELIIGLVEFICISTFYYIVEDLLPLILFINITVCFQGIIWISKIDGMDETLHGNLMTAFILLGAGVTIGVFAYAYYYAAYYDSILTIALLLPIVIVGSLAFFALANEDERPKLIAERE